MNNGFVYILLNPAFSGMIKIGETGRDSVTRAIELSRQTGVPEDFIVLYDELVSDRKKVEKLLHEKFAKYRSKRNKEFFCMPPKDAIKALQELASNFSISTSVSRLSKSLTHHFRGNFHEYLDACIQDINLVMLPGVTYLEVTKVNSISSSLLTEQDGIPLMGIIESDTPNERDLEENERLLKSCDAYDWIMISNLFPSESCSTIAAEWEGPEGRLSQRNS